MIADALWKHSMLESRASAASSGDKSFCNCHSTLCHTCRYTQCVYSAYIHVHAHMHIYTCMHAHVYMYVGSSFPQGIL